MDVHKCAWHFTSETSNNLGNEKLIIKKVHKYFKEEFFLLSSIRPAVLSMVNEVSKNINQLQLDEFDPLEQYL